MKTHANNYFKMNKNAGCYNSKFNNKKTNNQHICIQRNNAKQINNRIHFLIF